MFFIVRNHPKRVSHRANELTESPNAYHSRAPVVFRTETPRTHRVAPPCRRPGYLHWSIWFRDCRPGNRRRRQRHRALRKWPSGIYYHLQGCRLQTIQRRSTRRCCYTSPQGDIRHDMSRSTVLIIRTRWASLLKSAHCDVSSLNRCSFEYWQCFDAHLSFVARSCGHEIRSKFQSSLIHLSGSGMQRHHAQMLQYTHSYFTGD